MITTLDGASGGLGNSSGGQGGEDGNSFSEPLSGAVAGRADDNMLVKLGSLVEDLCFPGTMQTAQKEQGPTSASAAAFQRTARWSSSSSPSTANPNGGGGNLAPSPRCIGTRFDDNDMLFGRGGLVVHNPGNKKFLRHVRRMHPEYVAATTKSQKAMVVEQVIHVWRSHDPPGRFLRMDNATGLWIDACPAKVKENVSQAFRDAGRRCGAADDDDEFEPNPIDRDADHTEDGDGEDPMLAAHLLLVTSGDDDDEDGVDEPEPRGRRPTSSIFAQTALPAYTCVRVSGGTFASFGIVGSSSSSSTPTSAACPDSSSSRMTALASRAGRLLLAPLRRRQQQQQQQQQQQVSVLTSPVVPATTVGDRDPSHVFGQQQQPSPMKEKATMPPTLPTTTAPPAHPSRFDPRQCKRKRSPPRIEGTGAVTVTSTNVAPGVKEENAYWEQPAGTTSNEYPLRDIRQPHPHDVLCGRGGGTNSHIGNTQWRALVQDNKELYLTLPKKQKMLLSQSIVMSIRSQNPPGRFLKKDDASDSWYDVGDQKATEETSQLLREGAPILREKVVGGGGTTTAGGAANSGSSGDEDQASHWASDASSTAAAVTAASLSSDFPPAEPFTTTAASNATDVPPPMIPPPVPPQGPVTARPPRPRAPVPLPPRRNVKDVPSLAPEVYDRLPLESASRHDHGSTHHPEFVEPPAPLEAEQVFSLRPIHLTDVEQARLVSNDSLGSEGKTTLQPHPQVTTAPPTTAAPSDAAAPRRSVLFDTPVAHQHQQAQSYREPQASDYEDDADASAATGNGIRVPIFPQAPASIPMPADGGLEPAGLSMGSVMSLGTTVSDLDPELLTKLEPTGISLGPVISFVWDIHSDDTPHGEYRRSPPSNVAPVPVDYGLEAIGTSFGSMAFVESVAPTLTTYAPAPVPAVYEAQPTFLQQAVSKGNLLGCTDSEEEDFEDKYEQLKAALEASNCVNLTPSTSAAYSATSSMLMPPPPPPPDGTRPGQHLPQQHQHQQHMPPQYMARNESPVSGRPFDNIPTTTFDRDFSQTSALSVDDAVFQHGDVVFRPLLSPPTRNSAPLSLGVASSRQGDLAFVLDSGSVSKNDYGNEDSMAVEADGTGKRADEDVVVSPHRNDVLLGRGTYIYRHAGNQHFLKLVKETEAKVRFASRAGRKTAADGVVAAIRNLDPRGRFLDRVENEVWKDVGDAVARRKVMEAFRETRRRTTEEVGVPTELFKVVLKLGGGDHIKNALESPVEPVSGLIASDGSSQSAVSAPDKRRPRSVDSMTPSPVFAGRLPAESAEEELECQPAKECTIKIPSPSESDVLLGRSSQAGSHESNARFREAIAKCAPEYRASKGDAPRRETIVDRVIDTVQPGRFLEYDADEATWYQARTSRVREKVKRFLRDASRSDVSTDAGVEHKEARPVDFVLGRGGAVNKNDGNIRMRELVLEHRELYKSCAVDERDNLVQTVIDEWHERTGGRFLRPEKASGMWHELTASEAKVVVRRLLTRSLNPSVHPEEGAAAALMNLRSDKPPPLAQPP